ncbi:uncharacterized protein HD556DRAFT_1441876 [Suillus plorans]|uniref:Uncharacterized protein n=1 Tax=Suillus plorans TaxID=116603 RepID=A0A9P7DIN6_9AGAM|nr:uncharacterized protein HD556DRAFT_1441876 [Suillus plorans]KAG1796042.1 hypothetical protein HD556DRAFT_1441876 [Suillus plorans]
MTGLVRRKFANSAKFMGVNAKGLTGPLKAAAQPLKALFGGMASMPVKLEQDFDGLIASSSRVTFVGQKEARQNRAYRYIYQTLVGPANEATVRVYLDIHQLGHPGVFSKESCVVLLILEPSQSHGDGLCAPLQVTPDLKIQGGYKGLGGVGLFLGAVVAIKGCNGGRGYFIASEILAIPPMPASPATPSNMAASFDIGELL